MHPDPHDEELRSGFGALRRDREATTPSFAPALPKARSRPHASISARRRRLIYAAVFTVLLSAAVADYVLDRVAHAQLVADAEALTRWRSPTEVLLFNANVAWFGATPTLASMVNVPMSFSTGGPQ